MGRNQRQQMVLARQLAAAQKQVIVGARYRHYKSTEKVYEVVGLGFLEANDELCVLYRAHYGERLTFVRPLSVWLEQVEWKGRTVPRFRQLPA